MVRTMGSIMIQVEPKMSDSTQLPVHENVGNIDSEIEVTLADTPELVAECFRLRYQIYCLERNFEPGCDGYETDEFDRFSQHVLLSYRETGEALGTVRLILPSRHTGLSRLPIARVCEPELLSCLPAGTTGEISRFAISKQRRQSYRFGALVRLGLMQGVMKLSYRLGLTHWCAVMDPVLIRLLGIHSINFLPLGPLVEYHGWRQPTAADIGAVCQRVRLEQPSVWEYVTLRGALEQSDQKELVA